MGILFKIKNGIGMKGISLLVGQQLHMKSHTFFLFDWIFQNLKCKKFAVFNHFLGFRKIGGTIANICKQDAENEKSGAKCNKGGKLSLEGKKESQQQSYGE